MTNPLLSVSLEPPFAEIKLTQGKRRNPLSYEMLRELQGAIRMCHSSQADLLILSAEGPVFSAGHDFSDMIHRDLQEMRTLLALCSSVMKSLHSLPMPVVAKVGGHALGAGCQLVLSADFVVMADSAALFTPGGKGGWFCTTPMIALSRSVGRKRALEMLMSGEPTSAQKALEWGMVNRVVAPEKLDAETLSFAEMITRGSRIAREIGKRAFYTQLEMEECSAYEFATELMASSGMLPDAQETMKAFIEKRKPDFSKD